MKDRFTQQIWVSEITAGHAFDDIVQRRAFTTRWRAEKWSEDECAALKKAEDEKDPAFGFHSFDYNLHCMEVDSGE